MPWLDAAWHPAAWVEGPVPFDATDRGLLLGDGVFDTSLVLGGRMVFRAAHLDRLVAHARVLGFAVVRERLEAAVDGALERMADPNGALRLTLTRGPGPRGLAPPADPYPTIIAAVAPLASAALFAPLSLGLSAIRRNATSPSSRIKGLGYADATAAAAEARARGYDEALLLNGDGRVACACAGNIAVLIDRAVVTPPLGEGVLDGVTRAALMAAARRIGLTAIERPLALDDLYAAEAVVCTSSLRLVAPVTALEGRPLAGARASSSCLGAIAEAVSVDVGHDPRDLKAPA